MKNKNQTKNQKNLRYDNKKFLFPILIKKFFKLETEKLFCVLKILKKGGKKMEQFIDPPLTCKTECIPRVPISLVSTVEKYVNARMARFLCWHPKYEEMLIRTRFSDSAQLHIVSFPLGARKQITFFKHPVGYEASYDPIDGKFIIFSRDNGGDEKWQLFRLDLESGDNTLLTDGKKSRNYGVVWNNAGTHFAFISTQRNGKDRDVWMMDPRDPISTNTLLFEWNDKGSLSIDDWSPDDSALLLTNFISISETQLLYFSKEKGKVTELFAESDCCFQNGHFDADAKNVICLSDYLSDSLFFGFFSLNNQEKDVQEKDVLTGPLTPIFKMEGCDIEEFILSKNRFYVVVNVNDKGRSRLFGSFLNEQVFREQLKLSESRVIEMGSFNNRSDFSFNVNSTRSPDDVYAHNTCRWTESELGGMNPYLLQSAREIEWSSFDGLKISGFIFLPGFERRRPDGKIPVVINIHGGPEAQARPVFQGRNNYFINELGIAMIFPNVRGSTGFGKKFTQLDNGYLRENSVKDIGALLEWISGPEGKEMNLDADRICISGGSYGGYMSLACAVHYSDKVKCFIDNVGISNFVTFLENTEPYRQDLRRAEYGDERDPEMRRFLLSISPVTNVDRMTRPMLIVQGANDPRVPKSEAIQMVQALRKNRGETTEEISTVWYLEGTNEGHGFINKSNQDYEFYCKCMFIRRFLLDEII